MVGKFKDQAVCMASKHSICLEVQLNSIWTLAEPTRASTTTSTWYPQNPLSSRPQMTAISRGWANLRAWRLISLKTMEIVLVQALSTHGRTGMEAATRVAVMGKNTGKGRHISRQHSPMMAGGQCIGTVYRSPSTLQVLHQGIPMIISEKPWRNMEHRSNLPSGTIGFRLGIVDQFLI